LKRIDKLEKDLKKAIDENEKALNKKKKIVKKVSRMVCV
jgi:hypothetical protein